MTRRNLELALLCIAAPLVVLLFAMIVVHDGGVISVATLGTPLGIFAAFVVAHIAARKFAPNADPAILPLAFALSGIGIAFVTRLVPDLALNQVMWLFVGIVLMILTIALVRNLDRLAEYKYTLMLVGLALLLSPMIPGIGTDAGMGSQYLALPWPVLVPTGRAREDLHRAVPGGLPGPEPRDALGLHAQGGAVPPA